MVLKVWSLDQQEQHHLGNLFEMQILRPHPRPTELEILGVRSEICVRTGPPGDTYSRWRTTALAYGGS